MPLPVPTPSPYLTRHTRPERPARRLVCFPHAGGAASFYRPWGRYLDPSVELTAIQYPGRENRFREPLVPAMDPLASAVAEELLALPELPTVFFGHSMGAAVAYETLLRLEGAGAGHVTRLCVSGRSPDGFAGPAVRTDDEVVSAVRSLGGTNAAVFSDPDLRELLLPAIRNDYRLIDDYRRRPDAPLLRAAVHALTGDRDPQVTPDQAAGWRAVTSGAFRLTVLKGDHFYLVPEAEQVARIAMEPARTLPV
ncbi:thioesterase II family protein [Streptomyces indiaensis]|uniref:Alpha/beta fold hydrolase n=1 Tax=Streptomyces indiaensis TaxID=284033 RepID=A0ABN3EIM0_9ACTN|nr:alpha/beta fold hydrolase [Streptomyces indiaensis]MCF1649906.1 alpha/beta fold hydrolase [Streptomyces indiaensis]